GCLRCYATTCDDESPENRYIFLRSAEVGLALRPGFEPGTPRSKRGMMVHFTIGASSGRQGSRTLISVGRTALAERPGQPYPATFLRKYEERRAKYENDALHVISYFALCHFVLRSLLFVLRSSLF